MLAAARRGGRRRDRRVRAPPRRARRPRSRVARLRRRTAPRRPRSPSASRTLPSSEGRAGDQRLALEPGGDELQLVGGRAGPVDVAGRDLDLDLRLEQRRALQVGVRWPLLGGHPQRMLERVSDGRGRRRRRLLGPAARARDRAADPTRRDERPARLPPRLRCLPCAAGSVRARSAAIPVSRRRYGRSSSQAPERLCLRLVARPAQPEDLGAVDPAAPVEAPDGVRLAPPLHRLGPLLGQRRTARVPAGRTRARSRRPRSRADRGPRRPSPPRPRRAAPGLARHRRPG